MTTKPTNPKDIVGSSKVPMSVLPTRVLMEVGLAMLEGALKYGRHNYRIAGVRGSVYYDAVMRHMNAWWEGEDTDPDSQLSHITKAISTLCVLRDSMLQGNFVDDRPPACEPFMASLNERAAALVERLSDPSVTHYTNRSVQGVDMTDPRNWLAGDWVECVSINGISALTVGGFHRLVTAKDSLTGFAIIDDDGSEQYSPVSGGNLRFHARPDADGWIKWDGGECPVGAEVEVDILTADGEGEALKAGDFVWEHHNAPYDISYYRPLVGAK